MYGLNARNWYNEKPHNWGEGNLQSLSRDSLPHHGPADEGNIPQDKGKNMIQAVLSGLRPDTRYVLSGLCAVNSAPWQRQFRLRRSLRWGELVPSGCRVTQLLNQNPFNLAAIVNSPHICYM